MRKQLPEELYHLYPWAQYNPSIEGEYVVNILPRHYSSMLSPC